MRHIEPAMMPRFLFLLLLMGSCADPAAMRGQNVPLAGAEDMVIAPAGPTSEHQALETPDPTLLPPTSAWLAGTWVHDATADDLSRPGCSGGTVFIYDPDGTYFFLGEDGMWRLEGDVLTTTATGFNDAITSAEYVSIGEPASVRIKRVGPDEGAVWSGTGWEPMLRCRPGDVDTP